MAIDHVSITVANFEISEKFYLETLKPLGYTLVTKLVEYQLIGLGIPGEAPDFWFSSYDNQSSRGAHVGFKANSRKEVDAFYEAAMKAGATDNGKPGVRDLNIYGPDYYAAFVRDPDGHNVEVVCRRAEV